MRKSVEHGRRLELSKKVMKRGCVRGPRGLRICVENFTGPHEFGATSQAYDGHRTPSEENDKTQQLRPTFRRTLQSTLCMVQSVARTPTTSIWQPARNEQVSRTPHRSMTITLRASRRHPATAYDRGQVTAQILRDMRISRCHRSRPSSPPAVLAVSHNNYDKVGTAPVPPRSPP